ncbi:hypothetical protein, partial [Micromonospora saelicesensis]|uniref:hypothetical protein n=1 Tax=Micromonospora saelicesensis TaxID=285676 RepID=UPI001C65ABF6
MGTAGPLVTTPAGRAMGTVSARHPVDATTVPDTVDARSADAPVVARRRRPAAGRIATAGGVADARPADADR